MKRISILAGGALLRMASLLPSASVIGAERQPKARTAKMPATAGGPGKNGIPKVSAFMADTNKLSRAERRAEAKRQRRYVLAALRAGVEP